MKKQLRPSTPADKNAILTAFSCGNLPEADSLSRAMTKNHPQDAFGWKMLGVVLLQMGRLPEALPLMQKSVDLMPKDCEAHNNLGVIFNALGSNGEAEKSFRKAISLNACYAEAYNNLGNTLSAQGKHHEAETCFRRAIEFRSGYAEARNNLGITLGEMEKYVEAEDCLRKALALNPDYTEACNNLGNLLCAQGRQAEAEPYFRKAISLNPGYAEAYSNLGNALRELGRHADANDCFLKAIALNKNYAEAHNNLGVTLYELGQLAMAEASYLKALDIRPDYASCLHNLSQVRTYTRDDPYIPILRRLHGTAQNESDRTYACFGLAKAYEDLNDYDKAFSLYEEGNRLIKRRLGYSIAQDRKLFERIRSAFERVPEIHPEPLRGKMPVLVVGMPRSGTTLVEQILASHSEVFGAGELNILGTLAQQHFLDAPRFDLSAASKAITSSYLDELGSLGTGKRFVSDKMPLNFRWLGLIMLAQPEIKIVHVKRNPIAICLSNFRQYFTRDGLGFTHELTDLAEYYRLYEGLMQFWHEKFPGRIHDLNYERLTENQEEETRRLLQYCELGWEERCLEFEKTSRAVMTASAAQVRNKMYRGSSEAWRRFESHLAPLLEGLDPTKPDRQY